MIKVSSEIIREGHDLCGQVIYSNRCTHYKYDINAYEGFTRYYFDNTLLNTTPNKVVVLISKDLYNSSFAATYNCLYENELIKIYHCDVKEIISIK